MLRSGCFLRMCVCEPAASLDQFVAHHRDIGRRATERRESQTEEEPGQLAESATRRHGRILLSW